MWHFNYFTMDKKDTRDASRSILKVSEYVCVPPRCFQKNSILTLCVSLWKCFTSFVLIKKEKERLLLNTCFYRDQNWYWSEHHPINAFTYMQTYTHSIIIFKRADTLAFEKMNEKHFGFSAGCDHQLNEYWTLDRDKVNKIFWSRYEKL